MYYKFAKIVKNDIIDMAIKNNSNFQIEDFISNYGKINPREFFAKCFASMELGKTNEFGNALEKYLKGECK